MRRNTITDGLELSELCLGTMLWGTRNTAEEAHRQIDRALDAGVNCIDTAEMYPVNPISAETVGKSEEILGQWLAANPARRDGLVVATKVTGPNGGFVRDGRGYDGQVVRAALEASLRRLSTDYVDIYQLHWPERGSYMFRKNWRYDPSGQNREETHAHMRDVLETLRALRDEGKIRHFGLSNESAWGTMNWLMLAREMGAPEVVTVQNEYSLLCRLYDTDMAELSANEGVRLMAYSPLATGLLSGKYQGGQVPEGARMTINKDLGGRKTARAFAAVDAYQQIARDHGLDLVQMSLAWLRTRPFMGTAIFGASDMDQLERILGAADLDLPDAVIEAIDTAHRAHPMPY